LKTLVGNAFKYTDEGVIELHVSADPSWIDFTVSDTGQGISKELLPHIFEAFRQGSTGLSRTHGGVGLGLYIVVRLLELLGGTISVSSEVGEGSLFQFRIPRTARARTMASTGVNSVLSTPSTHPPMLLIPQRQAPNRRQRKERTMTSSPYSRVSSSSRLQ
jgi:hypothetical protein